MAKQRESYIGKNVCARVYFKDQKEYFEIHSDYKDGQKLLEHQQKMPYGESVERFIYGNLEGAYEILRETEYHFQSINDNLHYESSWKSLMKSCSTIMLLHPYFIYVKQAVMELYEHEEERIQKKELIDIHTLAKLINVYQSMRDDLYQLASVCLNPKVESDFSEIYKYISMGKENQLKLNSELIYGNVVGDIQALNDSYVIEVEDAPYPIVAPLLKLRKGNRPMAIVDVLYPNTLLDLHKFIISQYLRLDIRFKVCKNCDRYFAVVGNSKAEYCNRLMLGSDKTCRQAGAMRLYQSKKLDDPVTKAYTKAYKTRNARIRYGTMSRDEFEKWSVEARDMRDRCLTGMITLPAFEEWLSN